MKRTQLIFLSLLSASVFSQKYYTKSGQTEFKASVKTFEPIEAVNENTSALLDTENGAIASLLFVKAFTFRVALMQEHFNENYMDSNKFPKATFKGIVEGFNFSEIAENTSYRVKGMLTIKGIEKEIAALATFSKREHQLIMSSSFGVQAEDFGIEIPKIVRNKISKTIKISLVYEFVEKK